MYREIQGGRKNYALEEEIIKRFIHDLTGEVQMPVNLSYSAVFVNIFLGLGIAFAYLLLFGYRLLAISFCFRLREWRRYCLFVFFMIVLVRFFPSFHHISLVENVYLIILFLPSIVVGGFEMARQCRWQVVLISCIIETLLFPVWFDMCFLFSLFFEEAE